MLSAVAKICKCACFLCAICLFDRFDGGDDDVDDDDSSSRIIFMSAVCGDWWYAVDYDEMSEW